MLYNDRLPAALALLMLYEDEPQLAAALRCLAQAVIRSAPGEEFVRLAGLYAYIRGGLEDLDGPRVRDKSRPDVERNRLVSRETAEALALAQTHIETGSARLVTLAAVSTGLDAGTWRSPFGG